MNTFETIVAAYNAKDKAVAEANAIAVPCDQFHADDCIVWVRSRDRMLSIRYRGVNEIIAPESFAKDLRDILNGLFPVEADAVKTKDCAPKATPPAKPDEWPKVWIWGGNLYFQPSQHRSVLTVFMNKNEAVSEIRDFEELPSFTRLIPAQENQ